MSKQSATSENHDRLSHHPAILFIARTIGARPSELPPAILCGSFFFLILFSYYIMRPIREAAGIEGGIEKLPHLIIATMLAMLLVNPLFAVFVASTRRNRFVPGTFLIFALSTLVFAALFAGASNSDSLRIARVFYVWLSVLNLFAVSVFWAVMVDVWGQGQGRRLFGFLGVGGTLGAIAGAATTNQLVDDLSRSQLLLLAAGGLCLASLCARTVLAQAGVSNNARPPARNRAMHAGDEPGKRTLGGAWLLVRSPYLLGVSLYVLFFTVLSTYLYFVQATIVDAQFANPKDQTQFFALLDLATQGVTLVVQLFLTGRLIRWLGVGWALAALPLLTLVGFVVLHVLIGSGDKAALASAPVLWTFFAFQVLRRGLNYAVAKPTRELLYTVTSQQEKYGAKPIIDTFVYRSGDAIGAIGFPAMRAGFNIPFAVQAMSVSAIALWMAPLATLWLVVGLALGVAHKRRVEHAPPPTNPDHEDAKS